MNAFEIGLLLLAIPLGLVAAGYWLAAMLPSSSAAERLAVAMLAGLGVLTWTVSVVNLALPLGSVWGWACLLPWVAPLLRERLRSDLARDIATIALNRRGALMATGTAAFLAALLWPLLSRPDVVYYDGTSGHDGFFWIVGAEYLKRQTYLQPAVTNPVYPLYYSIESIVGLRPVWGRMGAEGLLALTSNLVGASPLKIYVAATAALFFPWVAAVFLVVRTFLFARVTLGCALALVTLQPVFLFFHANANLPNLLGAILGAGFLVALARTLATEASRRAWFALLALNLHGVMCCYPEMIPGLALTAGLLLLRAWWARGARSLRSTLGAVTLGLAINPVTTLRAANGLVSSIVSAGRSAAQGSIFDSVDAAAKLPAMVTLSASFGRLLGVTGGVLACVLVVAAGVFAIYRARDRFGAAAMLAGGAAILAYTLVQRYAYGWQKTVQFSGVFLAALLPFGVIGQLEFADGRFASRARRVAFPFGAAVAAFFAFAAVVNVVEIQRWSGRKFLTRDWFAAREFSRRTLHNVPVQVATETFDRPFFYTMWASYFLDESRIYYTPERASGGYLRPSIEKYPPDWREAPRALLVSDGAVAHAFWRRGAIGFAMPGAAAEREPKQ